jgi:hypothetical protein
MNDEAADLYDPMRETSAPSMPTPSELDYSIPGDLVMLYPDGTRPRIVVRTPAPREDWIAAPSRIAWEQPEGVPTTIEYRGEFYEISDVRRAGSAIEYHLDPWPEGELHRRVVAYSRNAELVRRSQQAGFARSARRARWMQPLYPLIGFLPHDVQLAIAERYPINIVNATLWSCAAETLFALYYLFVGGVLSALGSIIDGRDVTYVPAKLLGLPASFWIVMSPLLLLEAFLRWREVANRGKIYGNFLMELVSRFVR